MVMKILKNQIFFLLNMILLVSCLSNKKLIPSIDGYYRVKVYKSVMSNRTIIFGNLYEYKTNEPLVISAVKLNNTIPYKSDFTGKYKIVLNHPDTYTFTGVGMPYRFTETDPIKVNVGDSIRIDFYLKPDNTPLVD